MEYPAYQFQNLEKFQRDSLKVLNSAYDRLPESGALEPFLNALSSLLLSYDICNIEDLEIGLLVKSGSETGEPQFMRFKNSHVKLGRIKENDIPLKSPLVSKKHAEVVRRGVDYYLKDLNSNNGTYLNDVKLSSGAEVLLRNDDVIKIEPFEVVVGLSYDVAKHPLEIGLNSIRVGADTTAVDSQVCVYFLLQPENQTGVLALDESIAQWMVQKILAGQAQSGSTAWSAIEAGLLEYLAAKALSSVNPLLKNCRLVLQGVKHDSREFSDWKAKSEKLVEVTFHFKTELGPAYPVLYLPHAWLKEGKVAPRTAEFLQNADWIGNLVYTFAIQLGVSLLSADQVPLLEEGDIILLDRGEIALDSSGPHGKVELRCGQLQRGAIRGSLSCSDKGSSTLTIDAVSQEGLKPMSEAKKKTEGSGSGESMVSAVEIPVTVEFARVAFTLDELSGLKEGQVIELEKGSPELVDLSVDGKVFANGNLVDVEGKLGVRILKIVKGK